MLTTTLLLATLSIPVDSGQAPYDVAIEYCFHHGGLAGYSPKDDVVKFTCSDDLTKVIIISK